MTNKTDKTKTWIKFRLGQALFLGIFTLGIAMIIGDYATFIKSPINTLSISTTMFGIMGTLVCEIFSRVAKKW